MRTFDTPYITDWYAVSLRWLALLGMVGSLSIGGTVFETTSWPLAGTGVVNPIHISTKTTKGTLRMGCLLLQEFSWRIVW